MALLTPLYSAIENKVSVPVAVSEAPVLVTEETKADTNTVPVVEAPAARVSPPTHTVAAATTANASPQIMPDYDVSEITGLIYLGIRVAIRSVIPTRRSLLLRGRNRQDRMVGTTLVPR